MALLNRKPKTRPTPPPVDRATVAAGMRTFADDFEGLNGQKLAVLVRGFWKDGFAQEWSDEGWADWPTDEDRVALMPNR